MSTMIQKRLYDLADTSYRDFSLKLLPKDTPIIGVRIPILRKMSREISLDDLTDETFEEVMLQGMIIGNILDFDKFRKKCLTFLPKIQNWSVCDSFVTSLKITCKYPKDMLEFLKELVESPLEYVRRFVLVVLLHDYLKDEYMEEVLFILSKISKRGYFVEMACAWLLAELYSKNSKQVLVILSSKEYYLNRFIFWKTISKIRDSLKISKAEKEKISSWAKKYEMIWEV